jgi:hypothetical protein
MVKASTSSKRPCANAYQPHHQTLTPLGDVMPLKVTFFLS